MQAGINVGSEKKSIKQMGDSVVAIIAQAKASGMGDVQVQEIIESYVEAVELRVTVTGCSVTMAPEHSVAVKIVEGDNA